MTRKECKELLKWMPKILEMFQFHGQEGASRLEELRPILLAYAQGKTIKFNGVNLGKDYDGLVFSKRADEYEIVENV